MTSTTTTPALADLDRLIERGTNIASWIAKFGAKADAADVLQLIALARRAAQPVAPVQQNGKREGFEAAAKALQERAAGHFRNKNYTLQDECLQCASMLHDLKPVATPSPQVAERAPSIDTPAFRSLLEGAAAQFHRTEIWVHELECWPSIVEHIDGHTRSAIAASRRAPAPASAAAPGQVAKPELTVWYGPMPESNGKSNFTAILMRKGADFFDTDNYTFARGEYPDRVRYEADFMRYLIGERAECPEFWDKGYDFNKHSGYVPPDPKEPEFTLKEIAETCAKAGLGIFEANSLIVALESSTKD